MDAVDVYDLLETSCDEQLEFIRINHMMHTRFEEWEFQNELLLFEIPNRYLLISGCDCNQSKMCQFHYFNYTSFHVVLSRDHISESLIYETPDVDGILLIRGDPHAR